MHPGLKAKTPNVLSISKAVYELKDTTTGTWTEEVHIHVISAFRSPDNA